VSASFGPNPFKPARLAVLTVFCAFVASASLGLGLASAPALADVPQITITAGGMTEPLDGVASTLNLMFRVSADGVERDIQGHRCVIAQVQGDFAVDARSAAEHRLPYLDVRFTGAECPNGAGLRATKYRALPIAIGRNLRLDERLNLRVDAVGVEKDYLGAAFGSDRVMLFAKLAADAIGYKLVSRLSGPGGFQGVDVAAVNAEIGSVLMARDIPVRIVFGGSADVSAGGESQAGFAVRADIEAYSEVSADVTRYLRLFVRAGWDKAIESGQDVDPSDFRLLAGATFIF
jgi:hypothetical protein